MKYATNTLWLFVEKLSRMSLGLLVAIWTARYLGPRRLGLLNFASAVVSMLSIFVYLGLAGILTKRLVKRPEEKNVLLGTAFGIKFIGAIFSYCLLLLLTFAYYDPATIEGTLLLIVGLTLFLHPFGVIYSYNESIVKARRSVIPQLISFTITSITKVGFIVGGFSVVYFAFCTVLKSTLLALLMTIFAWKIGVHITQWKFDFQEAKSLIKESWLLIFSSMFANIYLHIDQIMLKEISGTYEVGIYGVAAKLSEIWYFVPAAIVASLFPKLIKLRDENPTRYNYRLQQLYDLLFIIALTVAIPVALFSKEIILTLYGTEYAESAAILSIHIWAGLFVFMRSLFSRWLIIEKFVELSIYSHLAGGITNVILNAFLIGTYGGKGAAIATLISYTSASYLVLFFFRRSRSQFYMMTKALFAPFRRTAELARYLLIRGKTNE